jgi:proteasome lid subunit RPN8/RPN11
MNTNHMSPKSPELVAALCHELVLLAKSEEDIAASEASRVPYWSVCPPSVEGHRAAARAIRVNLERLEAEARQWDRAC